MMNSPLLPQVAQGICYGVILLVSSLCSIPMQTHCTLRKLMLVMQVGPCDLVDIPYIGLFSC